MQPSDFCYWLQGFFEVSNTNELTKEQVIIIKDHLKLVFDKQTPNRVAGQLTFCSSSISPVYGDKIQVDGFGNYINRPLVSC